ncbi:MAG TPA: hypothetical protein VJO33_05140 [Gemmatimonadaceae bacterium]|nr:hypothetical protein [Gemmatimonadaceae bacterium]
MTLEQLFPGTTTTLRLIVGAVVFAALVLLGGSCWVYRAHRHSDDYLRVQLDVKQDSLKEAIRVRDSVEEQLAGLQKYALVLRDTIGLADRRADSLTRLAERNRTFRLRVIDSLHVAVTASDSDRAEEVHEVPIEITEQLALDSAALQAQDDRSAKKDRLIDVQSTENRALIKTVQLDSMVTRQLEEQIADLKAIKTPRLTFRMGVVVGTGLAVLVKLAVAALVR